MNHENLLHCHGAFTPAPQRVDTRPGPWGRGARPARYTSQSTAGASGPLSFMTLPSAASPPRTGRAPARTGRRRGQPGSPPASLVAPFCQSLRDARLEGASVVAPLPKVSPLGRGLLCASFAHQVEGQQPRGRRLIPAVFAHQDRKPKRGLGKAACARRAGAAGGHEFGLRGAGAKRQWAGGTRRSRCASKDGREANRASPGGEQCVAGDRAGQVYSLPRPRNRSCIQIRVLTTTLPLPCARQRRW
jgi:hypothetical protein